MASVHQYVLTADGSKAWKVRYKKPDGKSTTKNGFRLKRDADAFAVSIENSKLRGEYVSVTDGRITVAELGPTWLARQTGLKPSSLRPLEISWRVHVEPKWGSRRINDIRFTEVQQWVSELSKVRSASIVIRAKCMLGAILDDAVKDRRLSSNPSKGVDLPRKKSREHTVLTHEQVWAFAEAAGKNGPLILLLAYSGLRWGEASGLRVKDLDLLRRRVTVVQNAVRVGGVIHVGTPKSHHTRTVPVPAVVVDRLARQCEGKGRDDLVFPAPLGGYLKAPNGTRGWFERARIKAELPRLTPHDLRATAATLAVRTAGASVKVVQRMLGHASASMTLDVYGHLWADDLDVVADSLSRAVLEAGLGRVSNSGV